MEYNTYNAILNLFNAPEEEETAIVPVQRPPPKPPLLQTSLIRVYKYLHEVEELGFDNDFRLLVEEGKTDSLYVDQENQNVIIQNLQDGYTLIEQEQVAQNKAIAVLEDGLLPRVYYEDGDGSGAHLVFKTAEDVVDASTGLTSTIPSSAALQTYDRAGTVESSVTLQGNLVTIAPNVRIPGDLLLGDDVKTVQDQLQTLADRATQFAIEQATSIAAEIAQDALLAALSLNPFKLYPSGTFHHLNDLGAEYGVPDVVAQGKVSLNLHGDLCTRTFHMRGDLLQEHQMADDTAEFQSSCLLGSKVAAYNTSNQLTNPQAVAVRLGPNMNVQTDGTLNAASVNTDSVHTASVNGLATNKLIQRYQPTIDLGLSKRTARAVTSALQANRAIKTTLTSRNYSDDLLRIHDELLLVKRAFNKPPVLSRSYDDAIVAGHAETLSVKRGAYVKPVVVRSPDLALTRLRSDLTSVKRATIHPVLTRSPDLQITRLRSDLTTVKRATIHPVLTRSPDLQITRLRSDLTTVKRATIHPVVVRSPDLALTRLRSDLTSVKRATIHPVVSRSPDLQITRLRSDLTTVKRATVHPTLAPDFSSKIGLVRDALAVVKAYTAPISTSTASALKVVGTLSVSSDTTLSGNMSMTNTGQKVIMSGALQLPNAGLTGTRIRLHGTATTVETPTYSLGVSSAYMWYNVPTGIEHAFFCGGTQGLGVTSTLVKLVNTTVTGTLGVTGTSTLAGVSATSLTVTGSSTLAATTATSLGVSGNTLQLASATSNSAVFDQGGLLLGTGASQAKLTYDNASTNWVSNKGLTVPSLIVTGAISNSVNSVTTTFPGPTSSSYETWINVGSFTDSFTGTVTITLDNTDPKLCDCLDIDIVYNRSGLAPVMSANKSGNTNTITYYGFTAASLSNYALNGSGQVHTLYVGYGTIPDGKTFTAAYILRAGTFTLSKPLTYTNPNTSVGFVGPRYDPTYSCINCVNGTNNALVTNFLNGTVNIANAIADRIQVSQLTGKVQSVLNPAVNSYFTLGTLRNQFSGHVRIVLTTSAQISNATQVIDLAINHCQGQSTSSVVINNAPSPGVTSAPSIGITTAYISSGGDLVLKGPSVACNLYYTALNSDGYVDNQGNNNDGWDETTQAVSTTAPSGGQVINISNLGNTGFANGVDMASALNVAGTLNHTGGNANLCMVNTGNYIELAAGGAQAYIDFHAGLATDNTDYDARIYVANKNISLSAAAGVSITAGPLNFGRTGQLINTFSTSYGLGIQANTQYYRSAFHHTFYVGGSHSDTQGDSGGGNTVFSLNGTTYEAYLRGGTGNYTSVMRSSKNICMSGNVPAASQGSGTINFGITFTSPPIVCLTLDDAGGTVAAIYVAGRSTTGCSWTASNSGTSNRSINWIAHGSSTQ
jgi:hypothetical protein